MKRTIKLHGIKPISVNATLVPGHGGFCKSSAAKEFSYQLFYRLDEVSNQEALKDLREYFNPEKHIYSAEIIIHYPRSEFITKKNLISSKTVDVSNFEKPIIDILFLPKHFNEQVPYGVKNLNIDDKYLCQMMSKKTFHNSTEYMIEVVLEILDFNIKDNID